MVQIAADLSIRRGGKVYTFKNPSESLRARYADEALTRTRESGRTEFSTSPNSYVPPTPSGNVQSSPTSPNMSMMQSPMPTSASPTQTTDPSLLSTQTAGLYGPVQQPEQNYTPVQQDNNKVFGQGYIDTGNIPGIKQIKDFLGTSGGPQSEAGFGLDVATMGGAGVVGKLGKAGAKVATEAGEKIASTTIKQGDEIVKLTSKILKQRQLDKAVKYAQKFGLDAKKAISDVEKKVINRGARDAAKEFNWKKHGWKALAGAATGLFIGGKFAEADAQKNWLVADNIMTTSSMAARDSASDAQYGTMSKADALTIINEQYDVVEGLKDTIETSATYNPYMWFVGKYYQQQVDTQLDAIARYRDQVNALPEDNEGPTIEYDEDGNIVTMGSFLLDQQLALERQAEADEAERLAYEESADRQRLLDQMRDAENQQYWAEYAENQERLAAEEREYWAARDAEQARLAEEERLYWEQVREEQEQLAKEGYSSNLRLGGLL